MGILGFFVGGITVKAATDSVNQDLPTQKSERTLFIMLASMSFPPHGIEPAKEAVGFRLPSGNQRPFDSFHRSLVTVTVYKVCVENNVTGLYARRKAPPKYLKHWRLDSICLSRSAPLRFEPFCAKASSGGRLNPSNTSPAFQRQVYLGITLIFGAMLSSGLWESDGPSIVEPAIAAITYANITPTWPWPAGQHADVTSGTKCSSLPAVMVRP